jgi:uncharacterized RDD family membrane protein YckC
MTVALAPAQRVARRVHQPPPPERVEGGYAGLVTRTIAFAVDAALIDIAAAAVGGVVLLILSIFPVSHDARTVLAAVGGIAFVAWGIAYFVTFWTTTGQTPGNRVMEIQVVRADHSALRPRHALVRLVGMVISLPLLWGYIPILLGDRRRGVHDVLSGTEVRTVVQAVDGAD